MHISQIKSEFGCYVGRSGLGLNDKQVIIRTLTVRNLHCNCEMPSLAYLTTTFLGIQTLASLLIFTNLALGAELV